jgi:hypothetical protein
MALSKHWWQLTTSKLMDKIKSHWCHLLVCSSTPSTLQLLYWDHVKLFNKISRTRHVNMSRPISDKNNFLLFWKLLLKVQLSSILSDTWSIVSIMKSTTTHIKEPNWATIWNWKIKCHEHVDLMLPIRDLEYAKCWESALNCLVGPFWARSTHFHDLTLEQSLFLIKFSTTL